MVYEKVIPSGSHLQLEVELSSSTFTGAGRKTQHVPTVSKPLELKRSPRKRGRLPETRRRQLRYQMSFTIV